MTQLQIVHCNSPMEAYMYHTYMFNNNFIPVARLLSEGWTGEGFGLGLLIVSASHTCSPTQTSQYVIGSNTLVVKEGSKEQLSTT